MKMFSFSFYLGLAILLFFLVMALFAPRLSPCDPYDFGRPYLKPSPEHLLGTNDVGQDILSEIIYGSRVSLSIGLVSALVVTVIGASVGMISGYYGGRCDSILMKITSIAMAIPSLPMTIVLVAYLDASIWNLIIAICITAWTSTARIVRSRVISLKEQPFIKIEKTLGGKTGYILFRHILPNLSDIVFTRGILSVSSAMLTEASLSFLGLGVLGQKSWGGTLHYAYIRNGLLNNYYWWYLPPILCISLSVMGFMLVGSAKPARKGESKGC